MDDLPSNRLRLLIVENDRVTARDLEATLRRRGFVVMGIAYSAKQALDFLKSEKPDLVLLDIQLDGVEGMSIRISDTRVAFLEETPE
jgi:DNA-binding response OmpR family regulator